MMCYTRLISHTDCRVTQCLKITKKSHFELTKVNLEYLKLANNSKIENSNETFWVIFKHCV